MILVLPTYLVSGGLKGMRDIKDILCLYKKHEIESVALNFTEEGDISFESNTIQLNNLRKYCSKLDINISSITSILKPCLSYAGKTDETNKQNDMILKMIYIASLLEVPYVNFHGSSNILMNNLYYEKLACEIDAYSYYSDIARSKGVTICLENSFTGLLSTYDDFNTLLNQVKDMAFCYDTGNSYFVSPPDKWCDVLHDKIKYVHLSNIRIRSLRGMLVEFTELNKGLMDLRHIIQKLKNNKYNGYVMIEAIEESNQSDDDRIIQAKKVWSELYASDNTI